MRVLLENKDNFDSEIHLQDYGLCIYERAEWVREFKTAIKEVKDKYE